MQLAMNVKSFFLTIPRAIRSGEGRQDSQTPVSIRNAGQMSMEYSKCV